MTADRPAKGIWASKQILFGVCFGVMILAMPLQGQEIDWLRQFGSAGSDVVTGVAKDSTGIYVSGYTDGSLPGQTNVRYNDAFLRKYDFNGNELWTRQFGTTLQDQGLAVATDATGVYLTGFAWILPDQPDIGGAGRTFVRKYDPNGNELWTRQFGGGSVLGAATDATGVYVVGTVDGTLAEQNAGFLDIFVRKYDPDGNDLWTHQFGTANNDEARAVTLDATGLYMTGYTRGDLFGTSAGGNDVFVRKYDLNGTEQWSRQFGSAGDDIGQGITASASGVYVAGVVGLGGSLPGQTSLGGRDAFVRKYDANGTELWTHQFGTTGNDEVLAAHADGDMLYVTGNTPAVLPDVPTGTRGHVFMRKYDLNGTVQVTRQFGAGASEYGKGIVADGSGIYVGGYTNTTIPGQTSSGGNDGFVAKLTLSSPIPAGISAADEFSLDGNPNGPWSYGYSATLGGAFVLFDKNAVTSGIEEWITTSNTYLGVHANPTTAPLPWYTATIPPDELLLHPGPQGQYSMVRWTAPASGTYQIAGSFRGLNVNIAPTTDVHIRLNSATSLFTTNISTYNEPQLFALTQTVSAGDTIDFAVGVGTNGTYFNDGTGLQLTISTGGAGCTYSIDPTSGSIGTAGGTGSVNVNTQSGCNWTASSNASFVSITAGNTGSGSGSVFYSVDGNSGTQRTGTITIAGQTFTLTQDGVGGCTYTLSSLSQSFSAGGGTGSVGVTAGSGCAWTAASNAGFLAITSGSSGTGPGTVAYSVSANTGAERSGTFTIAGLTFTVTQAGAFSPPTLTLSSQSIRLFGVVGDPVKRQALQIGTSGGTINWQATATVLNGTGWLVVSPPGGTAATSLPSKITVAVDFAAFSEAGTYQAVITIAQANGSVFARIPVTAVVSAAGSRLLLSQTSFLFRTVEGGTAPSQDLRILNGGQGTMDWSIQLRSNRVTLSSSSGTASAGTRGSTTALSVDTAGLSPGVYQDLLRVSAPGAANNPQLVTVTLHVAPASTTAEPELSSHGILITVRQSTVDIPSFDLRVRNAGGGSASYQLQTTTESGVNWLSVSSTGGSLGSQAASVTVSPSLTLLTPGVYRGRITATFTPGGTREVEVVLVFADVPVVPFRGIPEAAACAPDSMEMVVTSVGNGSVGQVSLPRSLQAEVVDSCGNPLDDATVVATVEGRNITLSPIGEGFFSGTWVPEGEASSIDIAFAALHPTYPRVDRTVTVSTTPAAGGVSLPVLFPDGVVEGAAFTPRRPLAPGGIISLFGSDFATADAASTSLPLEQSLGGVSVEIAGEIAPLYFAGSAQINAQVPYSVQPGNDVPVVVTVNGLSAPVQIYQIAKAEPGIFLAGEGGAILDSHSQLVNANNPAQRGDVLQIFATGLGETNPPGQTGEGAPASSDVLLPVTVTIGGVEAPVQYQGLAPGFVGLYQVNVQLPTTVTPGDNVEVVIQQNGIPSNPDRPATIPVQ